MNEEINSTKTVISDCGPDLRAHLALCFPSAYFTGRETHVYVLSIMKIFFLSWNPTQGNLNRLMPLIINPM